jgi:hypothetical protein
MPWKGAKDPVVACTRAVHREATVTKTAKRHKHLKLDQGKIDFTKRYFGVASEQEAIDRAFGLLMQEQRIVRRLKVLGGVLRGDDRPWPHS